MPKYVSISFLVMVFTAAPVSAATKVADERPVWLVITKPEFQEAIKPLADKRRDDGLKPIVSTLPAAEAIAAYKDRTAFILLVGDDQIGEEKQSWYVSSPRRELYRWHSQQAKEFVSDSLLGDFDGDLVPDVPVGRIPVRTAEQLKLVITKILAFENEQPTVDDLRLPIWSGSPGYGKVLDSMTTGLLLSSVKQNLPPWVEPWIISADPQHSLCGWPPHQWVMFTKQLQRGGMFAAMIGHGLPKYFHAMEFNDTNIGYTAAHAESIFSVGKPAPPLIIVACDTGSFAGPEDCLAESLLFMPAGPVAVIGATTQSHPLTNYFSGVCIMQEQGKESKRLGTLWLSAQLKAMKTRDFIMEKVLIEAEGKLEEKLNTAKLRRDQVLMYALLGDPATKLRLPDKLDVGLECLNDGWHWKAEKPKGVTKLYVSFCPNGQSFPAAKAKLEEADAIKRFQQANATFAFKPLDELTADKAWNGIVNKEGTLRLVAVGQGCIYASAFQLKLPNMPSTSMATQN